jgi:prepilin-type N-terminal cleavage/methylation domain-containing protein
MKPRKGLTLTEIIIVIGLIALLSVFLTTNVFKSRNVIALDTSIDSLINDIKGQQIQAMTGYNQFSDVNNYYGIYFESNRYILFHSSTYQPALATNFSVNLSNGNQFSVINFPDNQIVFSSASGKITNFNPSVNSLTIRNINSNDQKTLYFNNYGVVYAIN